MKTTANRFEVPQKVWRKWTEQGRKTFNEVYTVMRDATLFLHPAAPAARKTHWQTTRWNAAWIAADIVSRGGKAKDYRFV